VDNYVADAIFIDAPPGRVLSALLDPGDVRTWMDAGEVLVRAAEGGEVAVEHRGGSRLRGRIVDLSADRRLELADCWWEHEGGSWGPMRLGIDLKAEDGGAWLTVRIDDIDAAEGWQRLAPAIRQELVSTTVALKRHIEGI
jgi:uncharacterized protein YndB with AHSA1/START domain